MKFQKQIFKVLVWLEQWNPNFATLESQNGILKSGFPSRSS